MSKNPFVNALCALIYIASIAVFLNFGSKSFPHNNEILIGISMISLFTLSAAVMGYLFVYQPIVLYFENKKKDAIDLFLKTILIFGSFTILLFTTVFLGIIK